MVRVVIIGDPHGDWDPFLDEKALKSLKPDFVLFTGDFGNEDVEMVEQVSELDMPKAVILGNHDCWWDGLARMNLPRELQKPGVPPSVKKQLDALGETHVGYKRMDFPDLKLSVVGARPFSLGGTDIFNQPLIESLYGISDLKGSAEKIKEVALAAPQDHALIFLGHNGPTGLGSRPNDICGNDFKPGAYENGMGDHGDPDLAEALKACQQEAGRKIPLVVFGHMHGTLLKGQGKRKMCVASDDGIIYVNAAVVPRATRKYRNFTVVELDNDHKVCKVSQPWLLVSDDSIYNEQALYVAP